MKRFHRLGWTSWLVSNVTDYVTVTTVMSFSSAGARIQWSHWSGHWPAGSGGKASGPWLWLSSLSPLPSQSETSCQSE